MRWRPEWVRYTLAGGVVFALFWFGWQDRSRQIERLQDRDDAQQLANTALAIEVARNSELARQLEVQVRALGEEPVVTLDDIPPTIVVQGEDEPEVQDPERQDAEPNDPEVQDPEVDDPEIQDPEIQDPEVQDPEIDDPDPAIPGPSGPPGPPGTVTCPSGFILATVDVNTPGGRETIFVCIES